tara:strand:+ start:1204 stop:1380 length:177 start_codon:yes stop_codon:yes gene_type:complete
MIVTIKKTDKKQLNKTLINYIEGVTNSPIDDLDLRMVEEFIEELNYWIDGKETPNAYQ